MSTDNVEESARSAMTLSPGLAAEPASLLCLSLTLDAEGAWRHCAVIGSQNAARQIELWRTWGWLDCLPNEQRHPLLELYRLGLRKNRRFTLRLPLSLPGGGPQWCLLVAAPTDSGEWEATLCNVHEDHLRWLDDRETLVRTNEHLVQAANDYKALQMRLGETNEKLNQIIDAQTQLASASLDLDAFLTLVVERMLQITPADGAVVELVEGQDMVYRAASGSVAPYLGLRLSVTGSLSGLCVQAKEVLIAEDTATDARVDAEACRKVGAASMVVAPLMQGGAAVGVLKVLSVRARAFCQEDVKTLQMMAGLIGSAIGHQLSFQQKSKLLAEQKTTLEALEAEVERRKLSEQQLLNSEEFTRRILETSHDAFVGMDQSGHIVDWNASAEKIFGWSKAQALGQKLSELLIPEDQRQAHERGIKHFLSLGEGPVLGRRIELSALTQSGKQLPVELMITAQKTVDGWYFSAFLHDISERKEADAQLRFLAQNDSLTGLPNRNLFYDRLGRAMARSRRTKRLMALMYLDVDRFKSVNDQHGHGTGDELLKAFASRILVITRECDTLARLAGDEFTLIAENLDAVTDAHRIADKIVNAVQPFFELPGVSVKVGASIGVAFYCGEELDAEGLLRCADTALYAAKAAGRNTFAMYEDKI